MTVPKLVPFADPRPPDAAPTHTPFLTFIHRQASLLGDGPCGRGGDPWSSPDLRGHRGRDPRVHLEEGGDRRSFLFTPAEERGPTQESSIGHTSFGGFARSPGPSGRDLWRAQNPYFRSNNAAGGSWPLERIVDLRSERCKWGANQPGRGIIPKRPELLQFPRRTGGLRGLWNGEERRSLANLRTRENGFSSERRAGGGGRPGAGRPGSAGMRKGFLSRDCVGGGAPVGRQEDFPPVGPAGSRSVPGTPLLFGIHRQACLGLLGRCGLRQERVDSPDQFLIRGLGLEEGG